MNVGVLLWLHQQLNITRQNRSALRQNEAGHVGQEVDGVEAKVVTQLLPADYVAQSGQVSNSFCVQLTTFQCCFVQQKMSVWRQLLKVDQLTFVTRCSSPKNILSCLKKIDCSY